MLWRACKSGPWQVEMSNRGAGVAGGVRCGLGRVRLGRAGQEPVGSRQAAASDLLQIDANRQLRKKELFRADRLSKTVSFN